MAKVGLLIGISEYEPGWNPLPAAVKDVEAIQEVLVDPKIGGFIGSDITSLKNPDRQVMEEAIYNLFASRNKDDLLLLFFSGHGIKDDAGKLYLATRSTRKTLRGELISPTAVEARFVHDCMSRSRSKRQVIVLDSCFSGAFAEGLSAKDDGTVDVRRQLGGEGRAVLTSSSSTQYSFEQEGEELSLYTRFLIEGIKTGEADLDGDEVISIDELHEYASRKVREVKPELKPEIYAVREGFKIRLAKVPPGDPVLKYRKEVARFVNRGEISFVGRRTLDVFRTRLGLEAVAAATIEDDVLEPYRKDFRKKLQQYEQVFRELSDRDEPISERDHADLQNLQQLLGLRNEDTVPIEAQVTAALKARKQNLQAYEQALVESLRQAYPLSETQQQQFRQMQQQMELTNVEVEAITARVTAAVETHQQHLQQYEQTFAAAVQQQCPLSKAQQLELQSYRESLGLTEVEVAPVEAKITTEMKTYQQKLQQYKEAFVQATQSKYQPNEVIRQQLQQTWHTLGLVTADVERVEAPILTQIERRQANLHQYEQALTEATQQQYPLGEETRLSLQQRQQQLALSDEDVAPIQTSITAEIEDHLQKLEQYQQVLSESIQFEYPLSEPTREEIQRFQQVLELSDEDVTRIEVQILASQSTNVSANELVIELPLEPETVVILPQSELTTADSSIEPPSEPPQSLEPLMAAEPKSQAREAKPEPKLVPLLETVPKPIAKPRPPKTIVLAGVGVVIVGLSSMTTLVINGQSRQAEESTLKSIKDLKAASRYDDCVSAAQQIKQDSRIYGDAQALLNECQTANDQAAFTKAKQLAKDSKFKEAITEAGKIPASAPVASEAKKLVGQWSDSLFQQAIKQYEAGKLNEAIATVQTIPADSPTGKQVQQQISQWKKEWFANDTNLKAAQKALDQSQWQAAIDAANKVTDQPFWKQKAKPIVQRAESQIAASIPAETPPLPTVLSPDVTTGNSSSQSQGVSPIVRANSGDTGKPVRANSGDIGKPGDPCDPGEGLKGHLIELIPSGIECRMDEQQR